VTGTSGFLDREPLNSSYSLTKCSKLIDSGIHNVFRHLHPQEQEFFWMNGQVATRIDHIWISQALTDCALRFNFYDSTLITDSNHRILVTRINITDIIPNNWMHTHQSPIT